MINAAGEDYSISSSDVILLEGETSKAVPIYLLNDVVPELEESFYVKLINETTGGAVLGGITLATITIEASDDPYGSFGNVKCFCIKWFSKCMISFFPPPTQTNLQEALIKI